MADVLFYHLERQPLERVLPNLLERTVQRGWRAVVQAGSQERVEALDLHLWTYADNSFLAHGTARDGNSSRQPIFLTTGDDNPNGAAVRFLVDGASVPRFEDYERIVCLFDGRDEAARAHAREQWQAAKAAGQTVTYWQQDEQGRWQKRA